MAGAAPTHRLRHSAGWTEIHVGRGAFEAGRERLTAWLAGHQAFVVTSAPLAELHADLLGRLEGLGARTERLLVPDGEAAKTLASAERLWSAMLAAAATRDSRVVAVGGGSVTDVAGFVAATLLRGVELALVPTSLLGQVDAAIGGKTAIDLPAAKNAVGAFWHPRLVIADTELLASLPAAELRSGLVEVVKIAMAEDADLFERLESELAAPPEGGGGLELPAASLDTLVARAVAAKIRVVESDPGEGDRRRVLNLGHTLGHAIEAALGYRHLRHGEAVAYGLLFALRLAAGRGGDQEFAHRARALLRRLEPPPLPPLEIGPLLAAMRRDKKARRGGPVWVLPLAPGRTAITATLDPPAVERELEAFLRHPWAS